MVRNTCAAIMGMQQGQLRVTASEIGGGFGGKTTVFIEPVALALSKKDRTAGEDGDEPLGSAACHRADRVKLDRHSHRHDQ